MRKTYLIILVQGVATVAALAFALSAHRHPAQDAPFTLDQLQDTTRITQLLHLDPAQAQQLALLNAGLRQQLQGTCQRNCAARRELIRSVPTDLDAQEAILMKMCKAYEDSERATLAHVQAVRALLDEEQRARLDALLGRCLCGGCETGCQ